MTLFFTPASAIMLVMLFIVVCHFNFLISIPYISNLSDSITTRLIFN